MIDFVPVGLSQFDADKSIVDVCTYDTIEANVNDLAGENMDQKVQNGTYRVYPHQTKTRIYVSNKPLAKQERMPWLKTADGTTNNKGPLAVKCLSINTAGVSGAGALLGHVYVTYYVIFRGQ